MPFINFSNPTTILLGVILFLLVLYLGRETKTGKKKSIDNSLDWFWNKV